MIQSIDETKQFGRRIETILRSINTKTVKMAENKTQPTEASVLEFLKNVTPETKKTDSLFC